jgi:hypothetical protein
MFSRLTLILITAFWLCMNYLLWRNEFAGRNHAGAKVPVAVVWQKILTAPDRSGLHILHHGKEIGNCDWQAALGQELSPEKMLNDGVPLDTTAPKMTGYRIDFNGSLAVLDNSPNRLRFRISAVFSADHDHAWQEFQAVLGLRPDEWELRSKAAEQTLHFRMRGEDESSDHVYKFSDLQNPRFLAQEFQLPLPLQFLDAIGLPAAGQSAAALSPGLVWEARNDWINLGHTAVRAYRLQARIFDRFMIIVMVSEVGEILRVELPDEWTIVNDQFSDF